MQSNPTIVTIEGLGEAAAQAQALAVQQQSLLGSIDPGTTCGMYPPAPAIEP